MKTSRKLSSGRFAFSELNASTSKVVSKNFQVLLFHFAERLGPAQDGLLALVLLRVCDVFSLQFSELGCHRRIAPRKPLDG